MILTRGTPLPARHVMPGTRAPVVGVDVELLDGVLRAVSPTTVEDDPLLIADGRELFTIAYLTVDVRLDSGVVLAARNGAHLQPWYATFLTSCQYYIKERYP